jgi:hypothetical protein
MVEGSGGGSGGDGSGGGGGGGGGGMSGAGGALGLRYGRDGTSNGYNDNDASTSGDRAAATVHDSGQNPSTTYIGDDRWNAALGQQ